MKQRLVFIFLLLLFNSGAGAAPYTYDYNDNCRKAYSNYLSLHIREARNNIIDEIRANPYNLMATFISDYEDCILLMLNCDKTDLEQRKHHLAERIVLLDKGEEHSPWHRFCKAGVYLHWAIIDVRFGNQFNAAKNFHKSFGLLKENRRLFPGFSYNDTYAGLEEAVVGSLPGSYKWLASIFGMKGSVLNGTEKLVAFVSAHTAGDLMYKETVLYCLYTRFYLLLQQKQAWDYMNSPDFSTSGNLLNAYVKTNLAIDYRKSDAAIEILQATAKDASYDLYPVFDYQRGVVLLNKTDTSCIWYFQQYLKKNKSDLYIKDCWQKMAFANYIAGNLPQAEFCRQQISLYGAATIDADKQARKFAESNTWPLKKLLQSRLLIEGGYYSQALNTLNSIDTTTLTNPADKAEYFFRSGRVYEESEKFDKALEYYQSAINRGKNRQEQFAARSRTTGTILWTFIFHKESLFKIHLD